MTEMLVRCPDAGCGASYRLDGALRGKTGRCTKCGRQFKLAPVEPPTDSPVASVWQPGDVIAGLYEVKGVLGEGGMGKVYRVHHNEWGIDLAVKSPRPEILARKGAAEDFETEAETWVNLGLHPHTAACYYVRRLGGIPRVFAECVEGGSLHDWVRTRRLYQGGPEEALRRILDIAIQFAWGLHHAHEQGLIHQDVKPHNVLMTPDGTAKVTDFGLAKARARAGEVAGRQLGQTILVSAGGMTPAYCSPEQAEGQTLSRRTDVWSWAVSVLEMFAGEVTWLAGPVAGEALELYLESGPPHPHLPAMPPLLASLLRRCLSRAPESRPANLLEVAAELQTIHHDATGQPHDRPTPRAEDALAASLNNRGVSLLDLGGGREAAAEQLWEEALRADPQHPESNCNLGLLRWRTGRLTDLALVRRLRDVSRSHTANSLPVTLLARVHLERAAWKDALACLSEVEAAGETEEVRSLRRLAEDRQASPPACIRRMEGHTHQINDIHLSPDGRLALSGSLDGTARLWEVATGRCLQTFAGHVDCGPRVCLLEDGRLAVTADGAGTLRVWETTSGRLLHSWAPSQKPCWAWAIAPLGASRFLAGVSQKLQLWDATDARLLRTMQDEDNPTIVNSLDARGRFAIVGGDQGSLRWWDIERGRCLAVWPAHGTESVNTVCLSRDGKLVVSGTNDRTARLWEVATGQCLRTFGDHEDGVSSVRLTLDNRLLLCGTRTRLWVWEAATGRCLRTLEDEDGFSDLGPLRQSGVAVCGGRGGGVNVWQYAPDAVILAPPAVARPWGPSDRPDAYQESLRLANEALVRDDPVTAAREVRKARSQPGCERRPEAVALWTGLYRRLRRTAFRGAWQQHAFQAYKDQVDEMQASADGGVLLTTGYLGADVRLWDSAGRLLQSFKTGNDSYPDHCTCGAALSRDGRLALTGTGHTLELWDATTGTRVWSVEAHQGDITAVCLSAEGCLALSGSGGRFEKDAAETTVRVWSLVLEECVLVYEGHRAPVVSLAMSADGEVAFSRDRDTVHVWETATGNCLRTFTGEKKKETLVMGPQRRFVLSPPERWTFCSPEGLASREIESGRQMHSLGWHDEQPGKICFSADHRHLAAGVNGGTVKLYDQGSGACLHTFEGHAGDVCSVHLSDDARQLLTAGRDGMVKVWLLDWELDA